MHLNQMQVQISNANMYRPPNVMQIGLPQFNQIPIQHLCLPLSVSLTAWSLMLSKCFQFFAAVDTSLNWHDAGDSRTLDVLSSMVTRWTLDVPTSMVTRRPDAARIPTMTSLGREERRWRVIELPRRLEMAHRGPVAMDTSGDEEQTEDNQFQTTIRERASE